MDQKIGAAQQPAGRAGDLDLHPFAQCVVELIDRGADHRLHAGVAGQHPGELEIVVAQQEQATAAVDQIEHDAQRCGAVGAIIRQVAKLHHEPVGRRGVGERGGVTMDITHHANGGVGRKRGCGIREQYFNNAD